MHQASRLEELIIQLDGPVDHSSVSRATATCLSDLHRNAYDEDTPWFQSLSHALQHFSDVMWLKIAQGPPVDDDIYLFAELVPINMLD